MMPICYNLDLTSVSPTIVCKYRFVAAMRRARPESARACPALELALVQNSQKLRLNLQGNFPDVHREIVPHAPLKRPTSLVDRARERPLFMAEKLSPATCGNSRRNSLTKAFDVRELRWGGVPARAINPCPCPLSMNHKWSGWRDRLTSRTTASSLAVSDESST